MEKDPVAHKDASYQGVTLPYDRFVKNMGACHPQKDALYIGARVEAGQLVVLGRGFDLFLQISVKPERFCSPNELRIELRNVALTEHTRYYVSEMLDFNMVGIQVDVQHAERVDVQDGYLEPFAAENKKVEQGRTLRQLLEISSRHLMVPIEEVEMDELVLRVHVLGGKKGVCCIFFLAKHIILAIFFSNVFFMYTRCI